MNKIILLSLLLISGFAKLPAQELNCNVIVNVGPKVTITDRSIFRDMETSISQFLNDSKWTTDNFEIEERIACNIVITIEKMPSISSFEATVQIQSSRPIYNTNYESILLNMAQNYADNDWSFEYTSSQPLEFNENTLQNNLTAILSFYAYMILGIDFDSFSKLGGTKYFEKAKNIANNADQQFGGNGWKQFVSPPRNRYWLADNFSNKQLEQVRVAIYEYHRLGLDTFDKDVEGARKIILQALKKIHAAYKVNPNAFLVTLFIYAKTDELVNVFVKGDLSTRREAYDILVQMVPTKTDKFKEIISN